MNRSLSLSLLPALLCLLSACQGLAGEPRIVSTVAPPPEMPTAAATAAESGAVEPLTTPDETAVLGAVAGQVRNGTAGAALPGALSLTLHVIQSEAAVQTFSTTTDAGGAFRFEQIPLDPSYQYMIVAPYEGTSFTAEASSVDAADAELTLPVTVYESGAPRSAVRIESIQTIAVFEAEAQITEIVTLVNDSDRAYVTSANGVSRSVALSLPQGARMTADTSNPYVVSQDGTQVISTRPLLPGSPLVLHLSYSMPYDGSLTFDQALDYPLAGSVSVLLPVDGFSLAGADFTRQEDSSAGDGSFARYGDSLSLAAGAHLRYSVQGARTAAQPFDYATLGRTILVVLAVVDAIAVVIAAMILLRKRRTLKASIGALVEQIATLDAQGQAGLIDPERYERERLALKARLKALMKASQ